MNLALFDFDETITSRDTFGPFLKSTANRTKQYLTILKLSPYFIGFKLKYISDKRFRTKLCYTAFKDYPQSTLTHIADSFAHEYLNTVILPHALNRIQWHLSQGDRVVVVSSSLDIYLKPWCKQYSLDLICNELECINSRYTGKLVGGDCGGIDKAIRIQNKYNLSDYQTIYAYGDSPNDLAMLELADIKFYQWRRL
ncbi:HAD hydrolase, family IB [Acinetobacter nectaris CIP 110549]|uniref:HAD hydrolase, family IB n=1 Tax=Acinetobacter nectaris CIP 110549 TaxID=1392540 RepID=V2TRC5_9GAMM|nr:HAD family hydrolase [Acinetobacter nectaris]ESK40581.1 HAD hydrolase, family IB [Acinetobacter nectaris CIP 110549]